MQIFRCDECASPVYFENDICVTCGTHLAFLPERMEVGSLYPMEGGLWRSPRERTSPSGYRLCQNGVDHALCNEAVPADSSSSLCRWCLFTEVIPDLSLPQNLDRWRRLQLAQRRLLYALTRLELPLADRHDDPASGLAFRFLADTTSTVLTGHENGIITLNIAEADDAEREERREQMGERYRTLLGHFRHEVGHYYWDRIIRDGGRLDAFREHFGDERIDYTEALERHYAAGPPMGWENQHISPYAASHPWEDWAETWAHYLHMSAVLETASSCGLSLRPSDVNRPSLEATQLPDDPSESTFRTLIESWVPVTYAMNALNRSMGLQDAYPFVLSKPVEAKLRFIHRTIRAAAG
ncbi:hypothetical protein HNR46_003476 [Haloferula luteola]|uniref:Zinc-ribbon domain-containing protein n=1 Tax=Haloferula luteola TaxID=595692 RepID=A0A840VKN3_9BACT|nr:putative zinc-binding metallopeptidase [Haloferula luteola]MBB5353221.1 hypothetical protein [Haloferula luteola]